jgi:hypothetical protein
MGKVSITLYLSSVLVMNYINNGRVQFGLKSDIFYQAVNAVFRKKPWNLKLIPQERFRF